MMRTELLRFDGAVERDPAIDAWMKEHTGELGAIAHQWFEVMRKCGDEVRELLHDGYPVVCLGDAPRPADTPLVSLQWTVKVFLLVVTWVDSGVAAAGRQASK